MPSIPLIGGPLDGGTVKGKSPPLPQLHFSNPRNPLLPKPLEEFLDPPRGPLKHIYNLSPCGRRYLHTSLVDQN